MRPRILIVDDDDGIRSALLDLLAEEAMEVVGVATNGADAVKLTAERDPDVVLMDLRMPVMDGITATGLIREADPTIQVVILSAYDDEGLTHSADEAGAYGYLVKGCPATLLREVIDRACVLRRGLQERARSA